VRTHFSEVVLGCELVGFYGISGQLACMLRTA
jgi:hypothetical protein